MASFRSDWRVAVPAEHRRALSRETGYSQDELLQAHLEVFMSIPGSTEITQREQHYEFRDYLRVFVRGGVTKRDREIFMHRMGIDPRDFDWDGWRSAMGYERRR